MINLLPQDIKSGYHFARRNVSLRRWVLLFGVAIVGLFGIVTFGLLSMHQSAMDYQQKNAETEALFKQEKYAETQDRVTEIGSSFKLAAQVLGNEVMFSKLLTQITTTIPAKASLTGLTISQTQSAIDISASAADYATATQLQVNLQDPKNKIFSKADIISITCDSTAKPTPQTPYPCTVSIRALFAPDNPYLLVNNKGTAK